MIRVVVGLAAAAVLGVVAVVAVLLLPVVGLMGAQERGIEEGLDIPSYALQLYMRIPERAEQLWGCVIPASLIASIGKQESDHGGGRINEETGMVEPWVIGPPLDGGGSGKNKRAQIPDTDNGQWDRDKTWDRAVGPMQFIPSSWRIYGEDEDGDEVTTPHSYPDAVLAAAAHLCGQSDRDLTDEETARDAVFGYNHAHWYVDEVMRRAAEYAMWMDGPGGLINASMLLSHPNFTASPAARQDLTAEEIDPRLVMLLFRMVEELDVTISVGVMKTGHYQCVGGGSREERPDCTESHHWYGRGADIGSVAGEAVSDESGDAHRIVEWMTGLEREPYGHPEVGSPWPEFSGLPGFFSDADHEDHLHIGVCGPRYSEGQQADTCP